MFHLRVPWEICSSGFQSLSIGRSRSQCPRVDRAHWPTKENKQSCDIFFIFPAHAKNGPRWAQEDLFPTNPDLADILGRTDFDFENFYLLDFFGSQISGLGPAWAHPLGPTYLGPAGAHPLGPGLGPPTWARLGPTHVGPAWAHPLGPGLGPPTWISRRRRRRRRRTNSQIQIQAPPNAPRDEILPQGKPSLLTSTSSTLDSVVEHNGGKSIVINQHSTPVQSATHQFQKPKHCARLDRSIANIQSKRGLCFGRKKHVFFDSFGPWKNCLGWPQIGLGSFFPG